MLNRVSSTSGTPVPAVRRSRLTADDRRRQLLGIGLSKLVVKPISDLSIDEVAAEAGISRGLLFHYFPTKRDFYLACVAAAGRRILRRTAPDPDAAPDEQVRDMVRLFTQQIERRREFYLSLVRGTGGGDVGVAEVVDTIREGLTGRVLSSLSLDDPPLDGRRAVGGRVGPAGGARLVGVRRGPRHRLVGRARRPSYRVPRRAGGPRRGRTQGPVGPLRLRPAGPG